VGRNEPGRQGTPRHVKKPTQRLLHAPLRNAELFATIGFGHGRIHRPRVLANPGPSVGGLTGGPGGCSSRKLTNLPYAGNHLLWNAAKVQQTVKSIAAPATQQFSALHDRDRLARLPEFTALLA